MLQGTRARVSQELLNRTKPKNEASKPELSGRYLANTCRHTSCELSSRRGSPAKAGILQTQGETFAIGGCSGEVFGGLGHIQTPLSLAYGTCTVVAVRYVLHTVRHEVLPSSKVGTHIHVRSKQVNLT